MQYDKVVALDADITAYANTDDLMAYPELSAVPELLFPIVSKEYLLLFNAGMLVLRPSMVRQCGSTGALVMYAPAAGDV